VEFHLLPFWVKKKDWIDLRTRIETLNNYMTEDFSKLWLPLLLEIVDQCLNVFDSKIDKEFWKSICKFMSTQGSGAGTYISGWINNFFPYEDTDGKRISSYLSSWKDLKAKMSDKKENHYYGRRIDDFHDTFCEAPVTWSYYGKESPMKLRTGFLGPVLYDDKTLMPEITWVMVRNEK